LSSDSTLSTTKCTVPPLVTSYSASQYTLAQSTSYLVGEVFASNSAKASALTDGDNLNEYTDTISACYFGSKFRENHVGVLSEVKIFMKAFVKSSVADKLKF
jgi:hypothetical protein